MSFHADLILPAENWASTVWFYELICPLHVTSDLFISLFHLSSTVQQSDGLSFFLLNGALNIVVTERLGSRYVFDFTVLHGSGDTFSCSHCAFVFAVNILCGVRFYMKSCNVTNASHFSTSLLGLFSAITAARSHDSPPVLLFRCQ